MAAETSLHDALLRIYRLQGDPSDTDPLPLSVTSPVRTSIKRVWPYVPPGSKVITDVPCFCNTWSPGVIELNVSNTRARYAVHSRLICYDADVDKAAKIAESFIQPIIARFEDHIKLSGLREWFVNTIRFEDEQPVIFEDLSASAGKTLLGLDFFIDITHTYGVERQGGTPPSWATV